jgi:hypothetical protein
MKLRLSDREAWENHVLTGTAAWPHNWKKASLVVLKYWAFGNEGKQVGEAPRRGNVVVGCSVVGQVGEGAWGRCVAAPVGRRAHPTGTPPYPLEPHSGHIGSEVAKGQTYVDTFPFQGGECLKGNPREFGGDLVAILEDAPQVR